MLVPFSDDGDSVIMTGYDKWFWDDDLYGDEYVPPWYELRGTDKRWIDWEYYDEDYYDDLEYE